MSKKLLTLLLLCLTAITSNAQIDDTQYNEITEDGVITTPNDRKKKTDSLGTDKEIPQGVKVWTVDRLFGDRTPAELDTVPHMFMNTIFTTGLRGEYITTGNLGAPRINRIFINRQFDEQFVFTQPYDFFITPIDQFHFTNTLSPITNISFNTCGNRTNGEDHLTAKFAVNAGKKLGVGFVFNYLYGRGYYSNQSTSHFDYTMFGSYLGDRYQAHLLMSFNHQKVAENGGITNDEYITHPEIFSETYETSEIPTVLEQNWNRNDNQHIFFTQRYNVGFNRKVKMTEDEIKAKKFAIQAKKDKEKRDALEKAQRNAKENGDKFDEGEYEEKQKKQKTFSGRPDDAKIMGNEPSDTLKKKPSDRVNVTNKATADSILKAQAKAAEDTMWLKNEYVPVTSFIHTLEFNNYRRIYQAYQTPDSLYANSYDMDERFAADSLYDNTKFYSLRNTVGISMLEGFSKWAKAGLKAFVTHEMRHATMPDSVGTRSWNEHSIFIGGQLSKTQGRTLHYNVTGTFGLAGEDVGSIKVDATADLNFKLFGDTVTLAASGFFHRNEPTFYYRHYHSRHFLWDNDDLSNIIHSRIQGTFSWQKTRTKLLIAIDEIKNYTYLGQTCDLSTSLGRKNIDVGVRQCGDAISLLTAQLTQDFTFGPVNWENVITYQKSSKDETLAVPDLNVYSNLYLRFKIAKVLKCDFGADVRYFTKFYAPYYVPALGQYAVQEGDNRTEVGNYPIVNVYANFHLKHTRFFVMLSHVNAGSGNRQYFLTPHYPLNERILRFGLSWNFFD